MKTNSIYLEPKITWIWGFIIVIAAFIAFSPLISVNELAYPVRIDSNYVKTAEKQFLKELGADSSKLKPDFYYLPGQVNMPYTSFAVPVSGGVVLKGWYIPVKENAGNAVTLLMLHDINESKINLLSSARQFNDRGFNVCLVDMRAHGESSGLKFTMGNKEVKDIMSVIDTIYPKSANKNIAVMGIGIGAGIALQVAHKDKRVKCIIAQSPPDSLLNYVKHYSLQKWGIVHYPMFNLMKRQLNATISLNIDTVNYSSMADCIDTPVMFLAAGNDDVVPYNETRKVFDASISMNKEYWPIKKATHYNIIDIAGEPYFNKISVFIVKAMPRKIKKSRFKKLI